MASRPNLVNRAVSLSPAELWGCVGVCIEKTSRPLTEDVELFSHSGHTQKTMRTTLKCHWFLILSEERICTRILSVLSVIRWVPRRFVPRSKKVWISGAGHERERQVLGALWMWTRMGYCRVLGRVPCAIQHVLVSNLFYIVCICQFQPPNLSLSCSTC